MKNDPRWINVKYFSHCRKCGKELKRYETALYFPIEKHLYCEECGRPAYHEFIAQIMDEESYENYLYNF